MKFLKITGSSIVPCNHMPIWNNPIHNKITSMGHGKEVVCCHCYGLQGLCSTVTGVSAGATFHSQLAADVRRHGREIWLKQNSSKHFNWLHFKLEEICGSSPCVRVSRACGVTLFSVFAQLFSVCCLGFFFVCLFCFVFFMGQVAL